MEKEIINVKMKEQESKSWTDLTDEELEKFSNVVACMYGCQENTPTPPQS